MRASDTPEMIEAQLYMCRHHRIQYILNVTEEAGIVEITTRTNNKTEKYRYDTKRKEEVA